MKVAVVGLHFGAEFVPIYQKHPDVDSVVICDLDPNRLAQVGARFGVETRLPTFEAVVAEESVDAVHLFTPVPLHAQQVLSVLASGKHCASAVPMATRLEDLRLIVGAQQASGKNYMLMETAIYDRAFLFVKGMLDRGELGNLTYLSGQYFQDLEGDFPVYWRGVPPMHYATHSLSPLLALAGTRANAVSCMGSGRLRADIQQPGANTYPLQSALFRLQGSDVAIQLTRSWFQIARETTEAYCVYGDLRSFEWGQLNGEEPVLFTMGEVVPDRRGRPVTAERVEPPFRPDLYPPELADHMMGWHGGSHPHLAHEFVRSIVEGRPPTIDAITAANWTAAGICANDSALLDGARVVIPRF